MEQANSNGQQKLRRQDITTVGCIICHTLLNLFDLFDSEDNECHSPPSLEHSYQTDLMFVLQ